MAICILFILCLESIEVAAIQVTVCSVQSGTFSSRLGVVGAEAASALLGVEFNTSSKLCSLLLPRTRDYKQDIAYFLGHITVHKLNV